MTFAVNFGALLCIAAAVTDVMEEDRKAPPVKLSLLLILITTCVTVTQPSPLKYWMEL